MHGSEGDLSERLYYFFYYSSLGYREFLIVNEDFHRKFKFVISGAGTYAITTNEMPTSSRNGCGIAVYCILLSQLPCGQHTKYSPPDPASSYQKLGIQVSLSGKVNPK